MGLVRFVFECFFNALGYIVGAVYTSHEVHTKAIHGIISGALFVAVSFLLIKFFCIDYEGYPKKTGIILLALIFAAIIALIYLVLVYWIRYRAN